ncbi:Acyl dehydratase [Actinokineospora alba]|uniref:Acyl dehydratase n=1 Tax=Actinokineospora alba TaxID=504798 RepID=A0A1H0UFX6_9PSEU|nr:MaoC/PaaZ C-terminal domain-containing protein [Actinokineospora alba]TDP65119.1 acyl dehydratase [Actinokineospora alba]SDH54519.1 Acyl dehydratase [Actinokineospora alba]SDP65051.1 Acyl dehydratase [Actinokineospora alba]
MPIDPKVAIGAELPGTSFTWTASDVLLYHLALGAGADPTSPRELRYALEDDLRVLPTFGVVAPSLRVFEPPSVSFPGISVDLAKVLHGSQGITVHGPIPADGKARIDSRIVEVWDKGKAAVIVQEATATSPEGVLLWTTRSSIFARGEGGFGGERGPATVAFEPSREPDLVIDTPTLPQQALLYRLCGDRNPLHASPEFAAAAGFPAPILHGLCTYGIVAKAITDAALDGDATRVRSFEARFAGVVYPGETLRTSMWADGDKIHATSVVASRDDTPVLSGITLAATESARW